MDDSSDRSPTCIDAPSSLHPPMPGWCDGAVHYRAPLPATGESYARCERHWVLRQLEEAATRRIPGQRHTPPAWVDPAAAGEQANY